MSLYIKCPDNSPQQIYVEEVVRILRRDYHVPQLVITFMDQTRHYYLPIPKDLGSHEKATLKVLMSELAKKDPQIKTGIFDRATEEIRRAVEAGKIKL
jgi:hypothetical protein